MFVSEVMRINFLFFMATLHQWWGLISWATYYIGKQLQGLSDWCSVAVAVYKFLNLCLDSTSHEKYRQISINVTSNFALNSRKLLQRREMLRRAHELCFLVQAFTNSREGWMLLWSTIDIEIREKRPRCTQY